MPASHSLFRFIGRLPAATVALASLVGLLSAPSALAAEDRWSFGIGTGLASLNLDGDIGFPGIQEGRGAVLDLDLDNSDTADLFDSAFGFASFANKGPLTIHFSYATLTLSDNNPDFRLDWDRTEAELAVEYTFSRVGNHAFGGIAGVRYLEHEWELKERSTGNKFEPDDDWTDAILGVTHKMPINDQWSWSNRADYGVGDSEGTWNLKTTVNWKPLDNWVFNGSLRYAIIEYNEEDDIFDGDYYYEADEFTIGVGFAYVW